MKYLFYYLNAGIFLGIVNAFIWLWHFDCKHFIDEQDFYNWSDSTKHYEPPIDY